MGACPECDGLGHIEFFDPKHIVAFPNLSLASGAVKGWDRRNQFYFQMLQNHAAFYDFDLDMPFEQLPESAQQVVLYGSENKRFRSPYQRKGRTVIKEHTLPKGVVNNPATSSIAKPIRWRSKKNSPNSSTRKNAHPATAPRLRGKHVTSKSAPVSKKKRFSKSARCRYAMAWVL